MSRHVRSTTQVARKPYICTACQWVDYNPIEAFEHISFADRRILVKYMRHKNGMIEKGDSYERQTYSIDGELYTISVHPEVDRIAREHELYPQDMD